MQQDKAKPTSAPDYCRTRTLVENSTCLVFVAAGSVVGFGEVAAVVIVVDFVAIPVIVVELHLCRLGSLNISLR